MITSGERGVSRVSDWVLDSLGRKTFIPLKSFCFL